MATISQTDRIKAEYARRERELPADLYSIAQPVNQFFRSQLNRTLIAALVKEGVFP